MLFVMYSTKRFASNKKTTRNIGARNDTEDVIYTALFGNLENKAPVNIPIPNKSAQTYNSKELTEMRFTPIRKGT